MLGYTERTEAQTRPEIRRSETVYRLPLRRIPADLQAFEDRWGRGRDGGAITNGFKSQAQYLNWRKRIRAALARATAPSAPKQRQLLPGWNEVQRFCADHQAGADRRVPRHMHLTLGGLGHAASAIGVDCASFESETAETIFKDVRGRGRRTLRRGIRSLGLLVERRAELPEIDRLLPEKTPATLLVRSEAMPDVPEL